MIPENAIELEIARRIADGETVDLVELGQENPELARRMAKLQALAHSMHGGTSGGQHWGHLQQMQLAGQGGFGAVYRAYDPTLDRIVALKLRHTDVASALPSGADFIAEARRLARVRHPHVLAVHGASYHDGRAGLWSDWIEGETLTARLDRSGPLQGEELLRVLLELADALDAVHQAGLVHGDVKASNVMLDQQGRVILMDFGAGFESSAEGSRMGAGTPRYLAPEILAGGSATTAVDLYACGVLAHLLASNRYPESAKSIDVPGPRALRKLIARLLDANPESRPTALEVRRSLRQMIDAPRLRVRRWLQVAVIAGLAGIALATSIGLHREQVQLKRAERISEFLAALFREQDPFSRNSQAAQKPAVMVADAVNRVQTELADDVAGQAHLLRVLGEAQYNLSEFPAAQKTLDQAANLAATGTDNLLRAEIDAVRGALARVELRNEDAERFFASALSLATQAEGNDSVAVGRIKARSASTLLSVSRFKDAQSVAESAHALLMAKLGPDNPETISALVSLGAVHEQLRQDSEALANLNEAVTRIGRRFGEEDLRLVRPLLLLGEIARRSREFEQGRTVLNRGIAIAKLRLEGRSSELGSLFTTLGRLENDAGNPTAAITAWDAAERTLPESEHQARAQLMAARGRLWISLKDGKRAEPDLRMALKMRREAGGLRTGIVWFSQAELAWALALQGRFAEALPLLEEAQRELRTLLGPDAYQNALIAERYVAVYELDKDWTNATVQARETVRIAHKTYGADHFLAFASSLRLASVLSHTKDGQAEATRIVDELMDRWRGKPQIAQDRAELFLLRCKLHVEKGELAAARELAVQTLKIPDLVVTAEQSAEFNRYAANASLVN